MLGNPACLSQGQVLRAEMLGRCGSLRTPYGVGCGDLGCLTNTLMKAALGRQAGERPYLMGPCQSLELKFSSQERKNAIETHTRKCINVGVIY